MLDNVFSMVYEFNFGTFHCTLTLVLGDYHLFSNSERNWGLKRTTV